MENKNDHLDDLVGRESQNPQPNNQRSGDDGFKYLGLTAIGLALTNIGNTLDGAAANVMYVSGIGFGCAALFGYSYSLYKNRKNQD